MAEEKQHSSSSDRGFASMDKDKQREIASKGGSSVPDEKRSFSTDHELASEAGRQGGKASHGGSSDDKGGKASHGGSGDDKEARGGSRSGGNFATDHERASEAGHEGGRASHGKHD